MSWIFKGTREAFASRNRLQYVIRETVNQFDDAEKKATRSAHNPEGYAAFSWLFPITKRPLANSRAAPTRKLE